jgi:hypothetical protein
MKGITSLDLSTQSPQNINDIIVQFLPDFLPNLREVDVSNTGVRCFIFFVLSENCPLLEKITSHNNNSGFSSCGYDICLSDHLKEINMDNSLFIVYYADKNRIADLSNHQEIFIFHRYVIQFGMPNTASLVVMMRMMIVMMIVMIMMMSKY